MSYSLVGNFAKKSMRGFGGPIDWNVCSGHGDQVGFLDNGTTWSASCSDGTKCSGSSTDPNATKCSTPGTNIFGAPPPPPPPPPTSSGFDASSYCADSGGVASSQVDDTTFSVTCINGKKCTGGAEQTTQCTSPFPTQQQTTSAPPIFSVMSPPSSFNFTKQAVQSGSIRPLTLSSTTSSKIPWWAILLGVAAVGGVGYMVLKR